MDYGSPELNLGPQSINTLDQADVERAEEYVNAYDVILPVCLPEATKQELKLDFVPSLRKA